MKPIILEYVWLDGYDVPNLRSKIKMHYVDGTEGVREGVNPPNWGFDGSSTLQADGNNSDCILNPVRVVPHPLFRDNEAYIVLCQVLNPDLTAHSSNKRVSLQGAEVKHYSMEMWFAFEQEYTIFDAKGERPYNWGDGYPEPQGRYYCGIGSDVAWGRKISEDHLQACMYAGIKLAGTNAEVMASQWEYQTTPMKALEAADNLWISRFILNRIAERHNATIKLDPKPIKGDWNGAGCHTNFSTKIMREYCPQEHIEKICGVFKKNTQDHIAVYGSNNNQRLTGKHETQHINTFSYGVADRGASIRIPPATASANKGYLEDRRPAANIDPYEVCAVLLETMAEAEQF